MQKSKIKNQNYNLKFKNKFFKNFGFWFVFLIFEFWILNLSCFAREINFEAKVDRKKVSLGGSIQLNLTFYGTQGIPAPELPEIDSFQSQYLGPSTMMSIVNGQVSSSITHMYRLIPLMVGTFQIGPFSFEYKGDTYTSKAMTVEVIEGPVTEKQRAQIPGASQEELKDRVFLVMKPEKRKAYLNEIIPLTIKLYVNRLAIRDIQYPEFEHEGFSVGKFDKPKQYQEVLGGILYDVIEFKTNVFGTRPGEFSLGPAQLKCNLIVRRERRRPPSFFDDFFDEDIFDNFFGRYESYPLNLSSVEIPVTILALPEEGKPEDFSGALGDFNLSLDAEPKVVKVGDPITLKMAITGEGNFNTVTIPRLESQESFKVYEPQIKQEKEVKIFEQVLIPKTDKIKEIPGVSFSFFNPERKMYQTITKGPIPIKVTKPEKEEKLKIVELPQVTAKPFKKEVLGRDIIYIKDSPGKLKPKGRFLYKSELFISIQFLPLLAIISALVFQKRKQRLETDIRYARRLRASQKAKKNLARVRQLIDSREPDKFFDAVFKTMQEYLGDKFQLPTGGITADVVEQLRFENVGEEILSKLKDCFDNCDMARYAQSDITREQMHETFNLLKDIINELERSRV
jgi:hypothetical protein